VKGKKGRVVLPPFLTGKEVNQVEQSSSKDVETTTRYQFDNFCRRILIGETSNYRKELARRSRHEITFSELSEAELERFYVMDEYSTDHYLFQVMGYDIEVKDTLIGEALEALSEKKRNIILLSYFMDMSDEEIGELLHLVRTTIYRHRTSSLHQIKKYMEGKADDEKRSKT
jgi:RNA polymerase sigma factor (sigma-70 family)